MYTKKNGRMTYKANRRPNFKRNNNFSSKNRNKGNVSQQYNKYLKLAKDTFSAGDRVQAEYYYQFTDHYFRLMQELGINIDDQDQDTSVEAKNLITESIVSENVDSSSSEDSLDKNKDDDEGSLESIPFIAEPIKKKRTRSSK